ncbi:hypothetical protein G5I_08998 [Acromyrmex echinatior]|uniref:Uncharacterized protein n=1 Tax=Acromyrmex echinatior TaxID=103372 RepID=F4WT24_ACREC|nr:hypothetical protein G5I_08998 [Acromyrmex echinatior]
MPAANAREKLTQASPYGRARCIDRLLRCTSSTLARENLTPRPPLRNPAAPPLPPTAASPAKPSRNPLCLHLVLARPGFRPVGCASIPDLTLLPTTGLLGPSYLEHGYRELKRCEKPARNRRETAAAAMSTRGEKRGDADGVGGRSR